MLLAQEFYSRSILPPPLNIIYIIWTAIRILCSGNKKYFRSKYRLLTEDLFGAYCLNAIGSICCSFVVRQIVKQTHKNRNNGVHAYKGAKAVHIFASPAVLTSTQLLPTFGKWPHHRFLYMRCHLLRRRMHLSLTRSARGGRVHAVIGIYVATGWRMSFLKVPIPVGDPVPSSTRYRAQGSRPPKRHLDRRTIAQRL